MAAMDIDSDSSPTAETTKHHPFSNTNKNNNTSTNASDEVDPIVASYDVFTNPLLPENRQLLILQHPNKQGPVRVPYPQISEVRVKNRSGMLEVDVPVSHGHADYDRDKGLRWGGALARSVAAKDGGTHGLAGGFGVGVPTRGGGGGGGNRKAVDLERELSMLDWTEAVRQDKVLRTQTLGGQFPVEKQTDCRHMVGVFKGDQLYLTPVSSLIHLRPQLHHLDAYTEQERLSRPREGAAGGPAAGGGAGKEGAAGGSAQGGGAKAIHMSIKSAGADSGEASVDTMIERLRKVQTEPWIKLKYEHEESERAWDMFGNHLIYASAKNAAAAEEGGKGKGKETEKDEKTAGTVAVAQEERYTSQWSEEEFLRAVSGLADNRHGDSNFPGSDEVQIKAEIIDQDPVRRAGAARGRAGRAAPGAAAAPAAKRGARGKSVAFKD
ncbi:hypothetical protein GGR53DRAFT_150363 [Hypoxylon sp. FL1150]|nr:hypothetical protein GGR53DRAFT_150363 [Hypoxylon sp. FL1150]